MFACHDVGREGRYCTIFCLLPVIELSCVYIDTHGRQVGRFDMKKRKTQLLLSQAYHH